MALTDFQNKFKLVDLVKISQSFEFVSQNQLVPLFMQTAVITRLNLEDFIYERYRVNDDSKSSDSESVRLAD